MEASVAVPKNATYESVLLNMEKLLPSFQPEQEARLNELAGWLLAMTQEDLQRCKQKAKQRGLAWRGKLNLFGTMREQDGFGWWNRDSVEIGDGTVTLIARGSHGTRDVTEKWEIIVTLQDNEYTLKQISHSVIKEFVDRLKPILICKICVEFSDKGEVARIVAKRNIDLPPKKEGSFHHRPRPQFMTHELLL